MSQKETLRSDLTGIYVEPFGLPRGSLAVLSTQLNAIRQSMLDEADLRSPRSAGAEHAELVGRAARLIALPRQRLQAYELRRAQSELHRVLMAARALSEEVDQLVVVGDLPLQRTLAAIVAACCHPHYNLLSPGERGGCPRLHFMGEPADNDAWQGVLDLLSDRPSARREDRWGIVASSVGPESADVRLAWGVLLPRLRSACHREALLSSRVATVARPGDWLHRASQDLRLQHGFCVTQDADPWQLFDVPTLLPLATLGVDAVRLLNGAAELSERFRFRPLGANPVLDVAAACHLLDRRHGARRRFLTSNMRSVWGIAFWCQALWNEPGWCSSEAALVRFAGATPNVNPAEFGPVATVLPVAERVGGATPLEIFQLHVAETRRDRIAPPLEETPPEAGETAMPDDVPLAAAQGPAGIAEASEQRLEQQAAAAGQPLIAFKVRRLTAASVGQLLQCLTLAALVECQLNPKRELR